MTPEPRDGFDLDEVAPWEIEDGAILLKSVEAFLSRFIAYPSEATLVAHTLWIAHTHRMDAWDSTPRIAFLSPEPGSGKSRALEVTELLVPNAVHAINTSPAYLFRRVADEAGKPTLLFDEIDTVFGPKAKENEDIRGMLNAGHRKGAKAGRCFVRGNTVGTEELDSYCAVALAGLDDLPDTIMSRSIVVRMRRRAPNEVIEPFRHRVHAAEGHALRDALASWATTFPDEAWPEMPSEITDRSADIWEALFAVADEAGGEWPVRARETAVTLVTDKSDDTRSIGIRLLEDLRTVFADKDHLFTEDILNELVNMELSPWADLRGKPLESRGLARRLAKYQVKPRTVRIGERTGKGYAREDLVDAWSRYVTDQEDSNLHSSKRIPTELVGIELAHHPSPDSAVTSVTTSQTDESLPPDDDYFLSDDYEGEEPWTLERLERAFAS
jgi:hypothetical protein